MQLHAKEYKKCNVFNVINDHEYLDQNLKHCQIFITTFAGYI